MSNASAPLHTQHRDAVTHGTPCTCGCGLNAAHTLDTLRAEAAAEGKIHGGCGSRRHLSTYQIGQARAIYASRAHRLGVAVTYAELESIVDAYTEGFSEGLASLAPAKKTPCYCDSAYHPAGH